MSLIGENLHIISPRIKEALINRDEEFVLDLIKRQKDVGIKTVDLNIGPAKNKLEGCMAWLINLIQNNFDLNISLDTTSIKELKEGFKILKNPESSFLNSVPSEGERLLLGVDVAAQYGCNLIALTMNSKGIPKAADERLELAFNILEAAQERGIENSKIYFDPLILPVCVEQSQASVALDTIRMIKESFDPVPKTIVGLSNISNGSLKELRPLINRVFFVLALGCGLDGAIVDAFDDELIRVYNVIKEGNAQNKNDDLYLNLYKMSQTFGILKMSNMIKMMLNKEIFIKQH
jgi:5-methyltetrahydrofolate corrinoid/iron sulfur protein methyltransferase